MKEKKLIYLFFQKLNFQLNHLQTKLILYIIYYKNKNKNNLLI